jgi:hypothetical protein
VRRLFPFIAAPPLALLIVGLLGSGVTAAVVALLVAGALGAGGAWFAFGGDRPAPPETPPSWHTSASTLRLVLVEHNGSSRPRNESGLVAHVR